MRSICRLGTYLWLRRLTTNHPDTRGQKRFRGEGEGARGKAAGRPLFLKETAEDRPFGPRIPARQLGWAAISASLRPVLARAHKKANAVLKCIAAMQGHDGRGGASDQAQAEDARRVRNAPDDGGIGDGSVFSAQVRLLSACRLGCSSHFSTARRFSAEEFKIRRSAVCGRAAPALRAGFGLNSKAHR